MLGRFGSMLGHLVGYVGFHGRLWNEKFNPNRKTFRLRFILGALEGPCRTNVGPFWVYVGPMLGHLVGYVGFHGGLWNEKNSAPTGRPFG